MHKAHSYFIVQIYLIRFLFLQKKIFMDVESKNQTMVFPKIGKIAVSIFGILLFVSAIWAYQLYGYIFKPNVVKDEIILIPTGSTFDDVEKLLEDQKLLQNYKAFRWVSKRKDYKTNIKPGRYEFKKGMNTNVLVNKLRNGQQDAVKVTFNNIRTFHELAGKVATYFEADSVSFLNEFLNENNLDNFKFSEATFKSMFVPNTYQLYWTAAPSQFVERMKKEYDKFWNSDRTGKAESLGMSKIEVAVLASIVQEETNKNDEKPVVAGVYLNRLKRGMLLQACPTVKYAVGDFTLRRITTAMTEIESPYNTYKKSGLPPGPITFPEISSIDAVLNAQKHDYLYFCAKDDFSGYNDFSRTLAEHNRKAARYQSALNQQRIWK